ncbi:MAG: hypothetical protein IJ740_11175 [Ruminococcus sp.]|nr:hypothetical protein [Ruminococcus sp.]
MDNTNTSGYRFNVPPFTDPRHIYYTPKKVNNSYMTYMAVLPFVAIFLENNANTIFLGSLIWGLVIIMLRFAAYHDAKDMAALGILPEGSKKTALISPVVYSYQRCKALGNGFGRFIAVSAAVMCALASNGFTQSMGASASRFVSRVQTRYLTELDTDIELDSYTDNYMVSDRMDIFTDSSSQTWTYIEADGKPCVVFTGKLNEAAPKEYAGKEIEMTFSCDFDGYNINNMTITVSSVKTNGGEVTDKDLKNKIVNGILHDWEPRETKESSDTNDSE